MQQLIIAEKPSLARNIVAGIGTMKRCDGYFEGNGYLVTWAFGHLYSLCDIEDYTGPTASGRWSLENIPCFPNEFRFKMRSDKKTGQVDAGVKKQMEIITALCNRPDVEGVINAGDADREGEIIIRLCIKHALQSKKRLYRLWLPDQTPQTVAQALKELKEAASYDRLADEGFARTYIDWLYGVNLTRYATLKTGTLLRVGRVIVPIVKAIYDRDMAIRHFVPDTYFAMVSKEETDGHEIELVSKKRFKKEEKKKAEELCRKYNETGAVVTAVKNKKDTLKPGKLYSLSKLQNVLGKKYKMSMEDSLQLVQGLYEKGFLTYPRTNSEYLATAEKEKIAKIIENFASIGYPVTMKEDKTIFDDSKIESHSALTPTYKIPKKEHLSEEEFKVYQTVVRRFAAVFCSEPCVAQKTEITVSVGDLESFTLKGTVILQAGWTRFDDTATKNKLLPPLMKGQVINTAFAPKEKETSPPKHYTIETLNNYLKNPFRQEKSAAENEDDTEEYRAMFEGLELGTEATRTGIIENAIHSHYIALNKDVYTILPDGEYLIESLIRMGISMDKYQTSKLGQSLKKVYRGEIGVQDCIALAETEIAEVFKPKEEPPETDTDMGFFGDEAGVCPLCGQSVVRSKYGYRCTGYKDGCHFSVSASICGRVISLANVRLLLSSGKTAEIQGFISKNGKPFKARLCLQQGRAVFDFQTPQSSTLSGA